MLISFIERELTQARNIRSKETRESTLSALEMIKKNLIQHGSGKAYNCDGESINVYDYEGNTKTYYCGNKYISHNIPEKYR